MKKTKFQEFFEEPQLFDCNSEWVISGEYSREQALGLFRKELDGWGLNKDGSKRWKEFTINDIKENRVRYCCQGADEDEGIRGWWLEASGKGSKTVWVLQVYRNYPPR